MTSFTRTRPHRSWSTGLIAAAMLMSAVPAASAQQSFQSPEDAAAALVAAAKSGSTQDILKVLGPDAAEIVDSGDSVADADARQRFATAYDAKHSVSMEGKKAILMLGKDDFPFPIPLSHRKTGWEFDTVEGRAEILYRRIGRNELDAIQTCLAFVDAENEYADKDRGAGPGVYAQRIVSSPDKKDGLYWPPDGDQSPLGELAAQAAAEGYKVGGGEPQPYHGYYYRILTQQGANAPGGELDYVVNGKMIGGFALIAYPADYGNSGVMTFLVNYSGTVYQKDLGELTEASAKRMKSFDPDQTWKKVEVTSP